MLRPGSWTGKAVFGAAAQRFRGMRPKKSLDSAIYRAKSRLEPSPILGQKGALLDGAVAERLPRPRSGQKL